MNNLTRFPHLATSPIFRDLPSAFVNLFLDKCSVLVVDAPKFILQQGDPVDCMYIVAHGEVEITSTDARGRTVLLHIAGQGDIFGEVEALSGRLCAANCRASANSTLLVCTRSVLQTGTRSTDFLSNLMGIFHDRLTRESTTKFVDQFSPLDQRLGACLYRLSANRPVISKTQADIAGYLGCARQTLNRELGLLRDQGIIELEKGRIRVLDRDGLVAGSDRS